MLGPLAEHGEVLRAGAGAVVAVPDRLRARLGCGDGRGPRPVPRLVADRRLAGACSRSSAGRRGSARARSRCGCRRSARSTATTTSTVSRPRRASMSGCSLAGIAYKPMLEHLARRRGHERRVVRVSRPRPATPPTLTPEQVGLILDSCARWDPSREREWDGLGAGPAAVGAAGRVGDAARGGARDASTATGTPAWATRRSWRWCRARITRTGCGSRTAATGKIYISDELDRLYGEYLWRLCDAGADVAVGDLDSWWVFVNLAREPRFAPLRAETVAWQVRRLRRDPRGPGAGRRSRRTGCGTRTRPRC